MLATAGRVQVEQSRCQRRGRRRSSRGRRWPLAEEGLRGGWPAVRVAAVVRGYGFLAAFGGGARDGRLGVALRVADRLARFVGPIRLPNSLRDDALAKHARSLESPLEDPVVVALRWHTTRRRTNGRHRRRSVTALDAMDPVHKLLLVRQLQLGPLGDTRGRSAGLFRLLLLLLLGQQFLQIRRNALQQGVQLFRVDFSVQVGVQHLFLLEFLLDFLLKSGLQKVLLQVKVKRFVDVVKLLQALHHLLDLVLKVLLDLQRVGEDLHPKHLLVVEQVVVAVVLLHPDRLPELVLYGRFFLSLVVVLVLVTVQAHHLLQQIHFYDANFETGF
uniref:(northern house mosquito) hypothetical protein n=1 Tax=Culex pipiens TaxID=7175 RepID=A0A8D8C9L7_CULPI